MKATEIRSSLYDGSKFLEALEAVEKELRGGVEGQERSELFALGAWCFYRLKKYAEAFDFANQAGSFVWARECLMYLAAYAPGYKNDETLIALCAELGDTVNSCNAIIIRARDADSTIASSDVLARVIRHQGTDVSTANLWHNGARFFLALGEKGGSDSEQHFHHAKILIGGALARYGDGDMNVHHRAAANHWKSKILEKIGRHGDAIEAARESERLWSRQRELDPKNPAHVEKQTGAAQWLKKLLTAVVLLATVAIRYATTLAQYVCSLAA
jgi:tetratricopeptide (TPR) repeat protein